jgi:hypothetical protein
MGAVVLRDGWILIICSKSLQNSAESLEEVNEGTIVLRHYTGFPVKNIDEIAETLGMYKIRRLLSGFVVKSWPACT